MQAKEFDLAILELMHQVDQKIADAQRTLSDLTAQKNALSITRKTYLDIKGIATTSGLTLSKQDVEGKSQHEIMKMIAQKNNRFLVVKDTVKIMKELDIFGNPANADSIVYSTLARHDEWAKVSAGVYKLNDPKEIEAK